MMSENRIATVFIVLLMLVSLMNVVSYSVESETNATINESGTEADPFLITNVTELQDISMNRTASYALANDIDASETSSWNGGKGFVPIENFAGSLDGQGYTIDSLYIDRTDESNIGIFKTITGTSWIKDLTMENADITGNSSVGALVGRNIGEIENCDVNGVINGNNTVGGLVGINRGSILDSYSTGTVNGENVVGGLVGLNENTTEYSSSNATVNGNRYVGGLVGHNYLISSIVTNSSADGSIYGYETVGSLIGWNDRGLVDKSHTDGFVTGWKNISGLIGHNNGIVSKSYSLGEVDGERVVGGIVGWNNGTIKESYGSANVNGIEDVGGLVGWSSKVVENSYATGNVNGSKNIGGLIGATRGSVLDSYSTGNVSGNTSIGGLIGWNKKTVRDSYSTAKVSGDTYVGGLVGHNYIYSSLIDNSYAKGDVDGTVNVGGLVGWNDRGTVDNSYSDNLVNGVKNVSCLVGWNRGTVSSSNASGIVNGDINIGGLIGWNRGLIEKTHAEVSVDGEDNVGGLIGTNNGTVLKSFATGDVNGNKTTGGLIGWNFNASVINTYAKGNVTADLNVGGLIGWNSDGGQVEDSYATGDVNGNTSVGGLIGTNLGDVWNCFWDNESSGIVFSDGGTGKSTSQMKDVVTYTDTATEGLDDAWDFVGTVNDDTGNEEIWDIDGVINEGYPFLSSEVKYVDISPSSDQIITAGDTIDFSAEAYHRSGSLITNDDSSFVWENTTDQGIFDETSVGVYHVSATYAGVTSNAVKVTVELGEVTVVDISPSVDQTIIAGKTISFSAWANDSYGNLITDVETDFTWENTTDTGLFEMTEEGLHHVSASYGGITSDLVKVDVLASEIETVAISPSENQTITAGEIVDFNASAYDEYGNMISDDDAEFTWENTNSTGIFSLTTVGVYNVTATYEGIESTAITVTVEHGEVAIVEIYPMMEQVITAGEIINFTGIANDTYGNLITDVEGDLTWHNTSETGIFNKTESEVYLVSANYGEVSSNTVEVTVEAAEVDMVTLSTTEDMTIIAGETINFDASAYDEYGNMVSDDDAEFAWENTDSMGRFSKVVSGGYEVTATYEGVTSDVVTVTVEAAGVDYVEITPSDDQVVTAGEEIVFSASAYDEYGNIISDDDTEFTWENADSTGRFMMNTTGVYNVTATYGGLTSNVVNVTVEAADVAVVELSPSEDQSITVEDSIDFDASAYDEYGNLITDDDGDFTWDNADSEGVFEEDVPDDYEVTAAYGGVTSDTVMVTVSGPIFEFSNLKTDPKKPVVGEKTKFMIDVSNVGEVSGEYTVEFYLNGNMIGSDTVLVDAGETETASINHKIDKEGDYTVEVEGETIDINAEEDGLTWLFWLLLLVIVILLVGLIYIFMRRKKPEDEEEATEEEEMYEEEEIPEEEFSEVDEFDDEFLESEEGV